MKVLPLSLALILVASAALALPTQDGAEDEGAGADTLESRVTALEKELADQRRVQAETERRLEQAIAYLHQQARASQSMLASVDASEAAGFTAGINFRSREILLAGFRSLWDTAQENLPAPRAAAADPRAEKASARR